MRVLAVVFTFGCQINITQFNLREYSGMSFCAKTLQGTKQAFDTENWAGNDLFQCKLNIFSRWTG